MLDPSHWEFVTHSDSWSQRNSFIFPECCEGEAHTGLPTKVDSASQDVACFGMQLGKASPGPSVLLLKGLCKSGSGVKLEML